MGEVIRTPTCPRCGSAPPFAFVIPYFCPNLDCSVVSWDPAKTANELADPAVWHKVDLPDCPTGNSEEA